MKNKLKIVLISCFASAFCAAAFSACALTSFNGVDIDTNSTLKMGGSTLYFSLGEEVDTAKELCSSGIVAVSGSGESVTVTKDVLESGYFRYDKIDTSSVGEKTAKVLFNGDEYTVNYVVDSFVVNFILADGSVYKRVTPSSTEGTASINLSTEYNYATDNKVISANPDDGLKFCGWLDSDGSLCTGEYILTADSDHKAEVNFYAAYLTEEEFSLYNLYYKNGEKVFGGLTLKGEDEYFYSALSVPESVTLVDLHSVLSSFGCASELYISSTAVVNYSDVYTPYSNCFIESVTVSKNNVSLSSYDGGLYSKDFSTLIYYPCRANQFKIHTSTQRINNFAFSCSLLDEVDLTGVKTVGAYCFAYSTISAVSLSVGAQIDSCAYILSDMCERIDEYDGENLIASYYVFYEDNAAKYCLYYVDSSLETYSVKEGTVEIAPYAFSGCDSLKSVTLPDGLKRIGAYAFAHCSALQSVKLPETLSRAEEGVFLGCSSLAAVNDVPAIDYISGGSIRLNTLPDYFFYGTALRSVTLSEGFVSVGEYAFASVETLKKINFPSTLINTGYRAFMGDKALYSITFAKDSALEAVSEECFYGCKSLKSFPFKKLTSFNKIEPRAFYNSGINSIIFNDSYIEINAHAFEGCTDLKKLSFGEKLTCVGEYAFKDCTSLYDIDFTNMITLKEGAFEGCTAIKEIVFSDTIFIIESYVFNGCTSLESIYFGKAVGRFGEYEFDKEGNVVTAEPAAVGCVALKEINVDNENLTFSSERGVLYTHARDTLYFLPPAYDKTLEIEPSVRFIYPYAISGYNAVDFVIPDGVERIYSLAISSIPSLKSLYIPYSIVKLYDNFYVDCPALSKITVDKENLYYYNGDDGDVYNTCPSSEKDAKVIAQKDTLAFQLPKNN